MAYVYFCVGVLILISFYLCGVTVSPAKCYVWSFVGVTVFSVYVFNVGRCGNAHYCDQL